MAIYKRYKGKRLKPKDKDWDKGTWVIWKRVNGLTIHKSIPEARTKEQAELAERRLIEAAFNKKYGVPGHSPNFKDFALGPYTRYVHQRNVNIGAKRLYIEKLCKFFTQRALDEITPQDCRDCQAYFNAREKSPSSVNRITSTLSRIFTLACEEGILDRNPMQYVKPLKEPKARTRLLRAEEKERLWKALESDSLMERLVLLAVNLPLRRGQLLAVTLDAIDFQNGLLAIIKSKGRESRVIPLNSTALHVLQLMKSDGQIPFPLQDFRKRWSRALKTAGIENFRFHDLRREFASSLIRQNVNPSIVQKLFAHSDMTITNVYIHSEMDELKQAVNTLDATIQYQSDENGDLVN